MKLRRGKTKDILAGSIDSASLAVEIYNKPRTAFRSEAYITLMVIAWTKLLHAYFHHSLGDRYYYRTQTGRYDRIDGERKAWELKTCIREYGKLSPPVVANLLFFIGLRNKIEHRHIARREVDAIIFGECQALLYNYENTLIELFGEEYALNENLVYSLQFSRIRTPGQKAAHKQILSKEIKEIREYVDKYRSSLSDHVFASQEYSIKLIQIPKISNTNRSDLAIEFVRWSELSEEDRQNYQSLTAIIKDKVVKKEVVNVRRLKAGDVLKSVKKRCGTNLNHHDHLHFYYIFSIRPIREEKLDPFETNPAFCHYDELHGDYVYQESWVDFLAHLITSRKLSKEDARQHYQKRHKLDVSAFFSPTNQTAQPPNVIEDTLPNQSQIPPSVSSRSTGVP